MTAAEISFSSENFGAEKSLDVTSPEISFSSENFGTEKSLDVTAAETPIPFQNFGTEKSLDVTAAESERLESSLNTARDASPLHQSELAGLSTFLHQQNHESVEIRLIQPTVEDQFIRLATKEVVV